MEIAQARRLVSVVAPAGKNLLLSLNVYFHITILRLSPLFHGATVTLIAARVRSGVQAEQAAGTRRCGCKQKVTAAAEAAASAAAASSSSSSCSVAAAAAAAAAAVAALVS